MTVQNKTRYATLRRVVRQQRQSSSPRCTTFIKTRKAETIILTGGGNVILTEDFHELVETLQDDLIEAETELSVSKLTAIAQLTIAASIAFTLMDIRDILRREFP